MILKTAAFALAASLIAAPAFAEGPDNANDFSFAFRYQPTELSSRDGATVAHARLNDAARDACRRKAPSAQRTVDTVCKNDLVNRAVAGINNANLSEVHRSDARFAALNR